MKRGRVCIARLASLLCLLLIPTGELESQVSEPTAGRQPNRYYGSVGLGFVNLDSRVGVGIPLGFTAVLNRYRLIGTVNALDIGLLEGNNRDPRYVRPYGSSLCVDSLTGYRVMNYQCSGGTNAVRSAGMDLSYIVFNEVWISDKPGKLFAGLGGRSANPQAFYATVGIYFDARSQNATGAKLAIGRNYVNMGIVWGLDLQRWF